MRHDPESPYAGETPAKGAGDPNKARAIRMLYAHGHSASAVTLGVVCIIGGYFLGHVPTHQLQIWFAAMVAICLWRAHVINRYKLAAPTDSELDVWHQRYFFASMLNGILLGGIWWVAVPTATFAEQLLLMLFLSGMAIGAISTLGSSLPTYFAYTAGVCGQVLLWQFAQGNPTNSVIGALGVVFLFAMILFGGAHNQSLQKVTKLVTSNRQLHEHQQRLRDFADLGADLFWEADKDGRFIYLSDGYEELTGVRADDMLGRKVTDPTGPCFVPAEHQRTSKGGFVDHCVEWPVAPDGTCTFMRSSALPILDADNNFMGLRGTVRDVTPEHLLSQELSHQANHDALTGLANRREFERALRGLLSNARVQRNTHSVCYLDLDQFKVVNDTCGHAAGDALLRIVADAICSRLRTEDQLARLGGDEFGLLLMSCDRDGAAVVAEEVREAIEAIRFDWDDRTFSVTASIGLVLVTEDSEDLAEVLMHADAACYRAKDRGRNRVQLFDTDIVALSEREGEMRWISHITKALDDNGFYLLAQPIVCLGDETGSPSRGCERFEMLLRMRTTAGENVSPGLFLPAAERYHIATRLDRWVVGATFDWMTDSKDRLEQIGLCSINLSGHSITDESFLRDLLQRLEQDPRVGSKLCFEITETAAMNNIDAAVEFIERVQEMGCTFALDDFGSGSASFGYLKSLPVDFVKIDGVFVRDMLNNDVDLAMVKAINDIGHIMGKQTIAEFVETTAVAERLKSMGVDFAQGYATGMPAPLDDLFQAPKKDGGSGPQSDPEAA